MSVKIQRKIPELLAPAGTKEAFIAAVEAGADAIYLGGKVLNARMGAGNFSLPEMKEAIEFAHKRKVKVYITVNTLVKDDEMEEAINYCRDLYNIGADALIIQDLGLGYLVKKYMPDFPIHLSTQGSIYDKAGVDAAASLGYERVVLARELSLDEIKTICKETETEIEVFCHGALCICYSGQCQMSRAIGARSGNRGACAQPCRLPYEMISGGKKKGYLLSPSDMNLIDYIGELSDVGVASLKIEGRMKSPEYVAIVVSIYRKYLDEYKEKGNYKVSDEDRFALAQIFNRGFTTAYINGRSADSEFMSGESPKHRGLPVGEVLSLSKIKAKDDRYTIEAKLNVPVEKNDVLEIGEARCKVTLLEGKYPKQIIGDVIGNVSRGKKIYRMASDAQIKNASVFYKNKDWHEGKFLKKNKLTWDVVSNNEGYIKCVLRDDAGLSVEVTGGPFEASEEMSSDDRIRESLGKMGGTPFEVEKVNIRGRIPYKIPVSKLNELRRLAVELMEAKLCEVDRSPGENVDVVDKEFDREFDKELDLHSNACTSNAYNVELYYHSVNSFLNDENLKEEIVKIKNAYTNANIYILLPAIELVYKKTDVEKRVAELGAEIIPYIANITKGKENIRIEKEFDAICELAYRTGLYIGNANWIKRFSDQGIKVYADYGLNRYNKWTARVIEELGAECVLPSLEEFDIGSGMYGRAPLMVSEHHFGGDKLIDRKGEKYDILRSDHSDQEKITVSGGRSISECVSYQLKDAQEKQRWVRVYI